MKDGGVGSPTISRSVNNWSEESCPQSTTTELWKNEWDSDESPSRREVTGTPT